jgi:hypothetical protein
MPPTPITWPKGATIAVTRLTTAAVLVFRPAIVNEVDWGTPPTGMAVDGALCCPTI